MDEYLNEVSKCEHADTISVFEEQEYKKILEYYKRHPLEWTEKMLGVELKWYQRLILKLFR